MNGLPYPVFSTVPDFDTPPVYGIVTLQQMAGLAPAADTAFFPHAEPARTFAFNFVFTDRAAIRTVKAFFSARAGRTRPFYLPSWKADLPAVSGTAGVNLLSVRAPGLTIGAHPDDRARQIFIWQPGEALFTSAVVSAVEGLHGVVELNLTDWLPFTIDPGTAIVGFLYLARFEEDDIEFTHFSADVAKALLHFRQVRQWNGETGGPYDVEQLDITGSGGIAMGFVSAVQELGVTLGDSRICYTLGPAVLHTPEAFPMATDWVAWANADGIRLRQAAAGQTVPDDAGTITGLVAGFVDTSHVAICFTVTGWETIAYQHTATDVRLWQKVFLGPESHIFTGLDPLLFNTGQLDFSIVGEDAVTVCYYRKDGENKLYARTSADSFAAETVAAVLPLPPLKLMRVYEDGRTLCLEYMDAGLRRVTLTSAEYPEAP